MVGLIWSSAGALAAPAVVDRAGNGLDVGQGYPDDLLGGDWAEQRAYGYQGPAGQYSCGQGRVDTYLARRACGGAKFPNRFF